MSVPIRTILFVCRGDTCLGPMATGLLKSALGNLKIADMTIESVGTMESAVGQPAEKNAIACMLEMGIDIKDHKSRPLSAVDPNKYDRIECLDHRAQVEVRMKITGNLSKFRATVVLNPFSQNMDAYRLCAERLRPVINDLIEIIASPDLTL